jgi:hypothetical protein
VNYLLTYITYFVLLLGLVNYTKNIPRAARYTSFATKPRVLAALYWLGSAPLTCS